MNALFELFELLWVTLNEIELVQKAIQFFLFNSFEITFGGLGFGFMSEMVLLLRERYWRGFIKKKNIYI